MIDHVVVDVEIQKCVGEGGLTWDDTDKLGVACACVWQYRDERMRVYGPQDVNALRDRLFNADRVSGFNIWKFDFPVIWGLHGDERVARLAHNTDDLLRRIWQALGLDPDVFTDAHKSWGLHNVAVGTLNSPGKIGYGGDAPKWFQNGEHARVINYCCDDVALERDLTTFVDRYGYVVNGATGRKLAISPWKVGV